MGGVRGQGGGSRCLPARSGQQKQGLRPGRTRAEWTCSDMDAGPPVAPEHVRPQLGRARTMSAAAQPGPQTRTGPVGCCRWQERAWPGPRPLQPVGHRPQPGPTGRIFTAVLTEGRGCHRAHIPGQNQGPSPKTGLPTSPRDTNRDVWPQTPRRSLRLEGYKHPGAPRALQLYADMGTTLRAPGPPAAETACVTTDAREWPTALSYTVSASALSPSALLPLRWDSLPGPHAGAQSPLLVPGPARRGPLTELASVPGCQDRGLRPFSAPRLFIWEMG